MARFPPFIDRPALIVVGAHDPQAPVEAANASAALMPNARVAVFPESGHCPFIEEPETFNRELEAFLAATARGGDRAPLTQDGFPMGHCGPRGAA